MKKKHSTASSNKNAITIVVPVYGDWPSLIDCVISLKKYVLKKHKVLLVNDCGPEVDIIESKIKRLIKDVDNFYYFRNSKNLGFLQNCNRAVLELDKTENDVLLLNSDTKVTEGFLEELQDTLYSERRIGVVSPRSNNATICTFPLSYISQKKKDLVKQRKLFKRYRLYFPKYSIAPTAHGFCILIRREIINSYGLFDEVFGKGYGEEVDLCQRIRLKNWKCAVSNRSFVYHLEARSFTLEKKAKLVEKSSKIIAKRYPVYKSEVQKYIQETLVLEKSISSSLTLPDQNTHRVYNFIKRPHIVRRFLKYAQSWLA